jgi:archaellum biogenesis ATPase FlaH
MANISWWRDADFQTQLLSFICRDRLFLKKCGGLLHSKDFKPGRDETDERYIIATIALSFWHSYKQPIGGMLRINVLDYCREHNVGEEKKKALANLVNDIVKGEKPVAAEAMEDRVQSYLVAKKMKSTLEDLVDKKASGKLGPDDFIDAAKEIRNYSGRKLRTVSEFLSERDLESRIKRRAFQALEKRPLLLIDDLDQKTRMIGRGDIGLIVGQYKKGKSLMLAHIGDAYAKQRLNVLYFALEDPKEEVEDRMDASLAYLPIERLHELPKKLRKRFKKFSRLIGGRIRIVDATDGGLTVQEIEEIWERQRDEGFIADVVIVDYDKEIKPKTRSKERRFEFEEIYTDLRQFASRKQVFLWTAAQAKRLKDNHKIITPDNTGEDIGKIQKCTMMIGIGQGEHSQDSRYLWVGAHKRGRAMFGCEIVCSLEKGLFYDRDRTQEVQRKLRRKNRKEE